MQGVRDDHSFKITFQEKIYERSFRAQLNFCFSINPRVRQGFVFELVTGYCQSVFSKSQLNFIIIIILTHDGGFIFISVVNNLKDWVGGIVN